MIRDPRYDVLFEPVTIGPKVAKNRFLLPEAVINLAEIAATLDENSEGGFSAAEFRDQTNIGRNLAIEILEFFDGGSAKSLFGSPELTMNRKLNILHDAAAGIAHLHDASCHKPVVHRDIACRNLLVHKSSGTFLKRQ